MWKSRSSAAPKGYRHLCRVWATTQQTRTLRSSVTPVMATATADLVTFVASTTVLRFSVIPEDDRHLGLETEACVVQGVAILDHPKRRPPLGLGVLLDSRMSLRSSVIPESDRHSPLAWYVT
jgi:hypothetical protein